MLVLLPRSRVDVKVTSLISGVAGGKSMLHDDKIYEWVERI
jgi:hypothetical protein